MSQPDRPRVNLRDEPIAEHPIDMPPTDSFNAYASDNNSNKSVKYRLKKYRPITQSFYGVHHHKKLERPTLNVASSIRNQTLALNEVGLGMTPEGEEVGEDGTVKSGSNIFVYPLKRFRTYDPNQPSSHSQELTEDEEEGSDVHSTYLQTTNSNLLQGNLSRLLNYDRNSLERLPSNYNPSNTQNSQHQPSNAYRPSEAFGLLFSKRASSLFENSPFDSDFNDQGSIYSYNDNQQGGYESLIANNRNSGYSTFNDTTELKDSVKNQEEMPDVDYKNLDWKDYALLPLTFFPPVFLGLILNFLNAVSYGMIIFPTQIPMFKDFGPDGIAMFLVSTAISQFVYTLGGSGFPCGVGGFMLEVVPFLHIIVQTILEDVGSDNSSVAIPTTMVAYALSSIITGVVFFLLGYFKLGNLVGFFPRHILVGCIGGVGYFLCQTALEVVSGVKLSYYEFACWVKFFEPSSVALWGTSILLAVTLKMLQRKINSPILLPLFYMMIPVLFFAIVNIFNLDVEHLRTIGWLFPIPDTSKPFYNFYLHFDMRMTSWSTLPKLVPIMLALTFFGILHVPINVPAVAVTTKTDQYDVNLELVGHGWSNTISGLFGSLQNYLMYSSSVLFFKSGGNDRFAGMMLAIGTTFVWMAGPGIVAYIPSIVLGSVIFHLGMELFKEGVYETYSVMTRLEYTTIWVIVVAMALLGFVEGVFIGIVLACLFFVYLYSQRSPIRSSYSGKSARSTVRRVQTQRQFLDHMASQIHVIKLQGFMFFGTIDSVETLIRNLIEDNQWAQTPISFVVLDLTLVTGLDFSAAEAFIRIRRTLASKRVMMILCGASPDSEVGMALHAVGVYEDQPNISMTFQSFNNALEWCENQLLEAIYTRQARNPARIEINQHSDTIQQGLQLGVSNSPRTAFLDKMGVESLPPDTNISQTLQQPLALLMHLFTGLSPSIDETLFKLSPHFQSINIEKNTILWNQADSPDGLYLVETGLLKVTVLTDQGTRKLIESILPGTMLGELALFTNSQRPFTVTADTPCKLWQLTKSDLDQLIQTDPGTVVRFMQLALAYSANELSWYASHQLN